MGRMNEPDVYLDHYNIRTLSILRLRNKFARLANALVAENKADSALMVLDRCMELMPVDKVPHEFMLLSVLNLITWQELLSRAMRYSKITSILFHLKWIITFLFQGGLPFIQIWKNALRCS
jgi:hypothetical protein